MSALVQDVRYAWQLLRKSPALTLATLLSLALGIGANTAVFSVTKALFFQSAGLQDPGRLVSLFSTSSIRPGLLQTSYKNLDDLRTQDKIGALAGYADIPIGLSEPQADAQPEQVDAQLVTGNYFDLLGVTAAAGRTFRADEDKTPGANPVVVVSDALWRRRFGARPDLVGRTVTLNTSAFTIIGIAPPGFRGVDTIKPVDVWVPVMMHPAVLTGVHQFYFRTRGTGMFRVVSRLAPGETREQFDARAQAAATRLQGAFPKENRGLGFTTLPLREARIDPNQRDAFRRGTLLLAIVVGLVLLIACANVANLLMAQARARRREIAVRLALGATRGRLVRQLLAEAVLRAVLGGLLGLGVAWLSLRALWALRPSFIPDVLQVRLDPSALAFTVILAVATGLLFGLLPALHASKLEMVDDLKGRRARLPLLPRWMDYQTLLLISQAALASVTLVIAGLFLRSLDQVQRVNPGFELQKLLMVSFDLGILQYDNTKGPVFVRRVVEQVRAVPGVVSAAVSSHVMLDGAGIETKIIPEGAEQSEALAVHTDAVGLGYFDTVGIPVLAGRDFRETDTGVSAFGWAIVNETMARRLWPGQEAVGRKFQFLGIKEPYVVVGLVKDAQYERIGEAPRPYFYMYYDQVPGVKKLSLHVRTTGDPALVQAAVRREMQQVDPRMPLVNIRTVSDVIAQATWIPRASAALLTLFALIALCLAAVGIYGVTAYTVGQRTREIGVRMALGAPAGRIARSVLLRGLVPTLIGLCLGVGAALLLRQAMAGLLYGIEPTDLATFGTAAIVLLGVAAIACYGPAVRAMSLKPASVLRQD